MKRPWALAVGKRCEGRKKKRDGEPQKTRQSWRERDRTERKRREKRLRHREIETQMQIET